MLSTLPFVAHGDTIPAVNVRVKYAGSGNDRRSVGAIVDGMLPFDHCAHVPITILGLDASTLPAPELINERNMQLKFLLARFSDLVISFRGGDFGTIIYSGTASGVEFLNLTPPAAPTK